jgi:peroxiredoxin
VESAKRYFVFPFIILVALASLHTVVGLILSPSLAWLGAALVLWPFLAFFVTLSRRPIARTSRNMPWQFLGACVGALLALVAPVTPASYYAVLGAIGVVVYIKWYSSLDRSGSHIVVGQPLPDFDLVADDESLVSASDLVGQPTLLMFVRGNWCPLCMAQIDEVAEIYQYLAEKGTRVVVVAAQGQSHTRELAARYEVPFMFCFDKDGAAANSLGIAHIGGRPAGLGGDGEDTIFPTVIITDAEGKVIFADQTDNYRVRPEPEVFLEIIETQIP